MSRLASAVAGLALVLGVVIGPGPTSATAGNSITSPDSEGNVGEWPSLTFDNNGYPVVSYYDRTNGDLKVLHCGDPNCTSGHSITAPDTEGDAGECTSLALDASGYPVVAYRENGPDGDLKVLHCGDADCTSGNSVNSVDTGGSVGWHNSLVLDSNYYPVVSYYDRTSQNLKVLHCGDADCTSGNSIASVDTTGYVVGWPPQTSLALDASGNPVVSYYDETNGDLKLLRCGDPNCLTGAVGGIAELRDVAGEELERDPSPGGMGLAAWLAAAIAVSAIVLGSAAWYARRRWAR